MEQEAFLDLDEFNESEINLDEPPRSAIHYLQQVSFLLMHKKRTEMSGWLHLNWPHWGSAIIENILECKQYRVVWADESMVKQFFVYAVYLWCNRFSFAHNFYQTVFSNFYIIQSFVLFA